MAAEIQKPATATTPEVSMRSPLSPPPEQRSWARAFLANLHDFLVEPAVRLPRDGARQVFLFSRGDFGSSTLENFRELLRPAPRRLTGATAGLLQESQPWWRSFRENLREGLRWLFARPLRTAQPVEVGELWNPPRRFRTVQLLSLLGHATLVALILLPLVPRPTQSTVQAQTELVPLDISPYAPLVAAKPGKKMGGGGGGGERNPIPPTRGRLPKFSWTQFAPPMAKIQPQAKLQMQASVVGPPQVRLVSPNLPNYGDPLAKIFTESGGPGSGAGIGTGSSGGVGSGEGAGVGPGYQWGTGGGLPVAGQGGYGEPECIYCPRPQFSDEAVKLKYQGTVLLRVIVTADGRAENIQIIRGLGLGLDEKAVEAVRTWRFKPALGPNGKPAAVIAVIEISFRLL
jgi:protein TonB